MTDQDHRMRLTPLRIAALALVAVGAVLVVDGGANARTQNLLSCNTMPVLMDRYVQLHISGKQRDAALLSAASEVFLRRYDGSKTLLLASEAERLERRVRSLLRDVDADRCDDVSALLAEQVAHHRGMEDFVRKTVSAKGYTLDRELTLEMDLDKRARPTTAAQRDDLRRRLIAFQLANYVRGGITLDEARERIVKRYELITRRIAEQQESDVFTSLLDAYAEAFDPHTGYFSADDLEDFRISMQLSLEGIGAVLRQQDGFTVIAEIVKGGAADRQGVLKPDDKIVAVAQGDDGEVVDVIDMSLRDVVRLIRGKKGTRVRLTVLREVPSTETFNVTIVRDTVDLEEQAAKLSWKKVERDGRELNLAVISLPSFYGTSGGRTSGSDVARLLGEARAQRADGVLLDLSRNSGGLLHIAVEIAGFFIREGAIVRVEGDGGRDQTLRDTDRAIQWNGPLVVHVSRLSASASEIVAGAIKDYRRGIITGDASTFGKGTVQNVVNLPTGLGALKVTTALFFRPSGVSTQKRGVPSDILVPSVFNSERFGEATRSHALPNRTTKPFVSDTANVEGPGGWLPVSEETIARLARASEARIRASEEFKEVREAIEKAEGRSTAITIGEILDGASSDDDAPEQAKEDEAEGDEDKLTPQVREALQILADLAVSQRSAIGARTR